MKGVNMEFKEQWKHSGRKERKKAQGDINA